MSFLLNVSIIICAPFVLYLAFRFRNKKPVLIASIAFIIPGITLIVYYASWVFGFTQQYIWFDIWIALFFTSPILFIVVLATWLLPPYRDRRTIYWFFPIIYFCFAFFAYSKVVVYMPNP